MRLTRRGRGVRSALLALLAAIVSATVVLGLGAAFGDSETARAASADSQPAVQADAAPQRTNATTGSGAARVAVDLVRVSRGDSLWDVARRAAPDRDPRAVVEDLREANSLDMPVVHVGDVLQLPVR